MVSQNSINNFATENDLTAQRTTAATTVQMLATQTNGGSLTSHAKHSSLVGGAAGGDPFMEAAISGTRAWAWGADNSDSDALKEVTAAAGSTDPSTGTLTRKVTTAGEQTMPLQPTFSAYLGVGVGDPAVFGTLATTYFLGTNVGLTEEFDIGGNFTPGPVAGGAFFTAPATGKYLMCATLCFQTVPAVGQTQVQWIFVINGALALFGWGSHGSNVTSNVGDMCTSSSLIYSLTAGDTVKIAMSGTGGIGNPVGVQGSVTGQSTRWSMVLLC